MNFGNILKKLREERGLTQSDLADKLNIARPTLTKYERNEREPKFGTLLKVAEFFNVSVDFLLGRTTIKDDNENNFKKHYPELLKWIDECIIEYSDERKSSIYKLIYEHLECLGRLDWENNLNELYALVQIQKIITDLKKEFDGIVYKIIEVPDSPPDNLEKVINKDLSINQFSDFNKKYIAKYELILSIINKLFQGFFSIALEDELIFKTELEEYGKQKAFDKHSKIYDDFDNFDNILHNLGKDSNQLEF